MVEPRKKSLLSRRTQTPAEVGGWPELGGAKEVNDALHTHVNARVVRFLEEGVVPRHRHCQCEMRPGRLPHDPDPFPRGGDGWRRGGGCGGCGYVLRIVLRPVLRIAIAAFLPVFFSFTFFYFSRVQKRGQAI